MRTVDSDRSKSLAGPIRSFPVLFATGSAWLGIELGRALWGPNDPFYPYTLILWGRITAFFARATFAYLRGLRYSVPLALADEKDRQARSLMPYVFGTAFAAFCFALSIIPANRFGTSCTIGTAILGMLTTLMAVTTERKIKKIARSFYSPADGVTA